MGFDWMAFAEGFMETAAENIKDKKVEARRYQMEQEELAKRNLVKISQRNATVNKVMGLTKMLSDNGASTAQIQAAIASGPNALAEFAVKVQEAVAAQNGKPLQDNEIETIIRMPKDFSPVDMELEDYVRKSYGYFTPNKGVGEKADVGFWDRLSGDAAMMRTKAKLDSSIMYDGYTAADINELAAQSDYQAVIPSTFATFADFKRFDNDARMDVERDIATKMSTLMDTDPDYKAAYDTLEDISPTSPIEEDIAKRNAALKIVKEKHAQNFGSIFDQAITTYGTQAITGLEDLMRVHMGDDYYDSLTGDVSSALVEDSTTLLSETSEVKKTEVVKEGNQVTMSNPEVFADEDGNAIEITFNTDENGNVVSANADGTEFNQEDAQFLYNDLTVEAPEPVEPEEASSEEGSDIKKAFAPFATEAEITSLSDASFPNDAEIAGEGPMPQVQDQEPNVDGPTDSALPQSGFDSAAIGSGQKEDTEEEEPSGLMSKRPKPRPELSLRQKTMERFGVTSEDIKEGMDTGSITELDLQLLNEEGDDIYEYIVEKAGDEPLDDMQLYYHLSRWADENNKRLPFNMNFLIFMLKKALADE